MQFSSKALGEKIKHLDEIKKHPDILRNVIRRNIGDDYAIEELSRIWTGGGGTSYIVVSSRGKFFLKVKNKSVCVESKLEEEESFIGEACVEHEKNMLDHARNAGVNVPDTIFFDTEDKFQFLATSYVEESLLDVLEKNSVEEILNLWRDLIDNVRKLFNAGMIHSDVHEYNLRVSNGHIVLIDLEETRFLSQNCQFEHSLDYCGSNGISSLGEFPLAKEQKYSVKTNSLLRMRQVFKKYLIPKVYDYIKECNYDSLNGICTALDHGKSELTYQSIRNKYFSIKGQRGLKDKRPDLIESILKNILADQNWTFVDVGSNNGLFCREIAKRFYGKIRSIGLEGFHKFNVLADALAFIEDCKNVEYKDFLCGEDDLRSLEISNNCFMTVCSVWHHIQEKDVFIQQLKGLNLKYILFEMPFQKECYEGRTWEDEVKIIKEKLGFADECYLAVSADYNRPLVLISKEKMDESLQRELKKSAKRIFSPNIFEKVMKFIIRL